MTIKRSSWALPYTIFMLLFVALPLIMVTLYAFRDGYGNFSLQNFAKFFSTPQDLQTLV